MSFNENNTNEAVGTASARTNPLNVSMPEGCIVNESLDPCTIIIVGASGDLTRRKVIPGLFNLFVNEGLPDPFLVVGCSRTKMSDQDFRNRMEKSLVAAGKLESSKWVAFAKNLYYCAIDYADLSSFKALADYIKDLEEIHKTKGNRVFELAIPPSLYASVARMIGKAGLSAEMENGQGWSRIVVEKPFGRDLNTAKALDQILHEHFYEHQIFRIDHYLAKETVQNVLMLRFANSIFEPVWNRNFVDHVSIMAAESIGVEHRAGYYEQAGVLRDMFQNHMMQLLALTAMEPPSLFEADHVRDEGVKVFRSLNPFPVEALNEYLILGQYGPGVMDGRAVPGYREEPGVDPDSLMPTFAMMRVSIGNWRWKGVPFFLTSGKRLARKQTEIRIQFKEVPHSMFRSLLGEHITANRLTLGIHPEDKIALTFQTKYPGARVCLRSVNMDFLYHQDYEGPVLDAYEKVLIDCIQGDQTLFWRQDGVEVSWSFLTPVLEECESCGDRKERLLPYESGSWGPEAAQRLREEIRQS
jgi:glucose-6-phosphate 1-dehydrogenase